MIRRCILWLVLPCFIINVALAQKLRPTTLIGLAHHKTVALVFSTAEEEPEGATSFITDILQEYLEFIGELPKTKKSKFHFAQSFKLSQFVSAAEPEIHILSKVLFTEKDSPVSYTPQDFFLSDYYNYLFRLTPF